MNSKKANAKIISIGSPKPTKYFRLLRPLMHDAQREIFDSRARFRVVVAGRRLGKTTLGAWLCLEAALRGQRAWWVAPTYGVAEVGWRMIKRLARQIPETQVKMTIRETERLLTFPRRGTIRVKSADNPDSLRGEGLDLVVLDEAAFIAEAAWLEALRPALADREGRAVFISTPDGRNWFWQLNQLGRDPAHADWESFHFPTSANPLIPASEIDAARATLPERTFRQEYLAEFLESSGDVFRNLAAVCTALSRPYESDLSPGLRPVIGVDLGRHTDFTVISVFDANTHTQLYIDRFNQIGWAVQVARIVSAVRAYPPEHIIVDQTGIGDVVIEQIRHELLNLGLSPPVTGLTLTADLKSELIDSLAIALEHEQITLLTDPLQRAEFESYRMERLPSGRITYNAPPGAHDDTVIAAALALWGIHHAARLETRPNLFWTT